MGWFQRLCKAARIRAAARPIERLRLRATGEPLRLKASAGEAADSPKTFSMVAYTGGPLLLDNYAHPVVVDLTGLELPAGSMPIFRDHDRAQIVGHTSSISIRANQVHVDGVISGTGAAAQEIVASSANGFPWEASIGAYPQQMELIEAGRSVQVNGQSFEGPVFVARKAKLEETSFVPLGADQGGASATVHAAAAEGTSPMGFEEWLKSKGLVAANLSESTLADLKKVYEAEQAQAAPAAQAGAATTNDDQTPRTAQAAAARVPIQAANNASTGPAAADPIAAMRAEHARINRINQICAAMPDIAQRAITEGWTADQAELHVLRARRPAGPAIHTSTTTAPSIVVIEAALCQAGRLSNLERRFSAEVLQAAHTQFHGRIGLQEVLLAAAWENGYTGRTLKGNHREVIRAAFSSAAIGGLLSNVANKFLLDSFMAVDSAWRMIAVISPVSDFKTATRYRLINNSRFEQVGPTGELKHGKLSEESFTNKANTYGELYAITREDQINDDLGALTNVPKMIGRDAALKLNEVFWTKFLDNATFFTEARGNLVDEGSVFGIDGLTLAEMAFMDQVGPDGKPLGLTADRIVVPPALSAKANALIRSTEVRDNAADSSYGTANPHAGKFKVIPTPYLSNPSFTGASSAAWYLLADPSSQATIEVVFLNGQETPTIEESDADFGTLGIQMRGFFDFGVALQEHRAGVKATGAVAA